MHTLVHLHDTLNSLWWILCRTFVVCMRRSRLNAKNYMAISTNCYFYNGNLKWHGCYVRVWVNLRAIEIIAEWFNSFCLSDWCVRIKLKSVVHLCGDRCHRSAIYCRPYSCRNWSIVRGENDICRTRIHLQLFNSIITIWVTQFCQIQFFINVLRIRIFTLCQSYLQFFKLLSFVTVTCSCFRQSQFQFCFVFDEDECTEYC